MSELLVQRLATLVERAQRCFGIVAKPRPVGAFDPLRQRADTCAEKDDECSVMNLRADNRIEHDARCGTRDQRCRHRQNLLRSSGFGHSHRRDTTLLLQITGWHADHLFDDFVVVDVRPPREL